MNKIKYEKKKVFSRSYFFIFENSNINKKNMNKTGSIITTITIIYRRNNNLTIMYVRDKNKDSQREFLFIITQEVRQHRSNIR